jgi:hypothetical protein
VILNHMEEGPRGSSKTEEGGGIDKGGVGGFGGCVCSSGGGHVRPDCESAGSAAGIGGPHAAAAGPTPSELGGEEIEVAVGEGRR